jgi:hypothetical protein
MQASTILAPLSGTLAPLSGTLAPCATTNYILFINGILRLKISQENLHESNL